MEADDYENMTNEELSQQLTQDERDNVSLLPEEQQRLFLSQANTLSGMEPPLG